MKKKRRESKLAAVIDVGSHAVRMDVLQLSAGEKPVLLEGLRREVDLGRAVFRAGEVPPGEVSLLCDIFADFRRKLEEYPVPTVRAAASGPLREAANSAVVVDRIFRVSGILPEVPEAAEESRRFAADIRRSLAASGIGADSRMIAVRADAWSMHVLGFEGGALCFAEELPVGGDRLPEGMADDELARALADRIAASGVLRRLKRSFAGAPEMLATAGGGARRIAGMDADPDAARLFDAAEFRALADRTPGAAEAAGVVAAVLKEFPCGSVAVSGLTARSMLLDPPGEDDAEVFSADLAGVAAALGGRFAVDRDFAERTAYVAVELWKKLRTRCSFPERTLPLLETAARLRDVGNSLSGRDAGEASEYVIDSLFLPGVTDAERRLVATAVRFAGSRGTAPENIENIAPALRPELFRMAAILRAAAVLALTPGGVSGMRLNFAGDELVATFRSAATGAERAELERAAELFLRVFGVAPRIGEAAL